MKSLSYNMMVFGGGSPWKRLGQEGGVLMNGIKETPPPLTPIALLPCGNMAKVAIHEPGSRLSLDVKSAGALILHF
jgi:hypothetical protein